MKNNLTAEEWIVLGKSGRWAVKDGNRGVIDYESLGNFFNRK